GRRAPVAPFPTLALQPKELLSPPLGVPVSPEFKVLTPTKLGEGLLISFRAPPAVPGKCCPQIIITVLPGTKESSRPHVFDGIETVPFAQLIDHQLVKRSVPRDGRQFHQRATARVGSEPVEKCGQALPGVPGPDQRSTKETVVVFPQAEERDGEALPLAALEGEEAAELGGCLGPLRVGGEEENEQQVKTAAERLKGGKQHPRFVKHIRLDRF